MPPFVRHINSGLLGAYGGPTQFSRILHPSLRCIDKSISYLDRTWLKNSHGVSMENFYQIVLAISALSLIIIKNKGQIKRLTRTLKRFFALTAAGSACFFGAHLLDNYFEKKLEATCLSTLLEHRLINVHNNAVLLVSAIAIWVISGVALPLLGFAACQQFSSQIVDENYQAPSSNDSVNQWLKRHATASIEKKRLSLRKMLQLLDLLKREQQHPLSLFFFSALNQSPHKVPLPLEGIFHQAFEFYNKNIPQPKTISSLNKLSKHISYNKAYGTVMYCNPNDPKASSFQYPILTKPFQYPILTKPLPPLIPIPFEAIKIDKVEKTPLIIAICALFISCLISKRASVAACGVILSFAYTLIQSVDNQPLMNLDSPWVVAISLIPLVYATAIAPLSLITSLSVGGIIGNYGAHFTRAIIDNPKDLEHRLDKWTIFDLSHAALSQTITKLFLRKGSSSLLHTLKNKLTNHENPQAASILNLILNNGPDYQTSFLLAHLLHALTSPLHDIIDTKYSITLPYSIKKLKRLFENIRSQFCSQYTGAPYQWAKALTPQTKRLSFPPLFTKHSDTNTLEIKPDLNITDCINILTTLTKAIEILANKPDDPNKNITVSKDGSPELYAALQITQAAWKNENVPVYTHSNSRVGYRSPYCSKTISYSRSKSLT